MTSASDAASTLRFVDLRGGEPSTEMLPRPDVGGDEPLGVVRDIIADVRGRGDAALIELTDRFDGVDLASVRVPADDIDAAAGTLDPALLDALRDAAESIRAYHETEMRGPHRWVNPDTGVAITSRYVPVERVGCYVPGGRAVYPSTVLMTAIPARMAGVTEVALCVPPSAETKGVSPIVLAAARIAGVDEVYAVGGAQAIAAMAYGTETVRPVDIICGPGNRYVALAKQEVAGRVGVAAAFAGPSEVVVVADASVDPAWVAMDIMVQVEHGPDGLGWLVSWDEGVLRRVMSELDRLTAAAPRAADIRASLAGSGYAVLVDGPAQALAVSDFIAPEHLELLCDGADDLADRVRNAGAIFCGPFGAASMGDYAAGPSHVLPTHSSARFASALGVGDFVRHQHIVSLDADAFLRLAPTVERLAQAEGLPAHAASVAMRVDGLNR